MQVLRKVRNRVHIQNSTWEEPRNENEAFNERMKIISEKVLEKIIDTLASRYPRRTEYQNYVADFELPWEKHFK